MNDNFKNKFILAVTLITSFSCAHTFMRGSVAKKIDAHTAYICLGKNDVKVGDYVEFKKNDCFRYGSSAYETRSTEFLPMKASNSYTCNLEVIGVGVVTDLIDEHYSIVKTRDSFNFNKGTLVEKVKK